MLFMNFRTKKNIPRELTIIDSLIHLKQKIRKYRIEQSKEGKINETNIFG